MEAELPVGYSAALSQLELLIRIHPQAPFYAGALVKAAEQEASSDPGSPGKSALLFTLALESSSPVIRCEAARELILPALETRDTALPREILSRLGNRNRQTEDIPLASLRAACLYRLERFAELVKLREGPQARSGGGGWDRALPLLAGLQATEEPDEKLREDIRAFFLNAAPDEAWRWASGELARLAPDFFSGADAAALSGRAAAARSAFDQGALFFWKVLEQGRELFFRYPELITDAGRCFQFSPAAREEGAAVFAGWAEELGKGASGDTSESKTQLLCYRAFYYAGRIARQQEQYRQSGEYFAGALDAAPDPLQADACIWYILMNALAEDSPETAAGLAMALMPRMSQVSYFDDVMDRLSRYLVSRRQWDTMLEIFNAMDRGGAMAAQYAWILGRAVQEGYIETRRPSEDFFRIAFEEGNASVYYRAMSASKLGTTFAPAGEDDPNAEKAVKNSGNASGYSDPRPITDFLLGFFEFGAMELAAPRIREHEKELTIPELRTLAKALSSGGSRNESISLVSCYMAREEYELSREDLLLYYPRHFRELIEQNAHDAALGAEILFGLIRTESFFMPGAVSRSGAVGLAQLMAPTALDMADRIARQGGPDYRTGGEVDLKDPDINVHIGAYYLGYLTDQLKSPMLALLAYNGGMGRVRRWRASEGRWAENPLPDDLFLETIEFDETREYGRQVLAAAAFYGYLYYGMGMEMVVRNIYR
jgi:soluble lytic murein transglycosylase